MTPDLTPTTVPQEDLEVLVRDLALAFGEELEADELALVRGEAEADRTLGVRDDKGQFLAGAAAQTHDLSLPGGARVPTAVVSLLAVRSVVRRRGLGRRLLGALHEQARERGEALAVLHASEATIYGRFGYAQAEPTLDLRLDVPRSGLRADAPGAEGALASIPTPEQAVALALDLWEHLRDQVPGMPRLTRSRATALLTRARIGRRSGGPRQLLAIGDRALASYHIHDEWRRTGPHNTLRVGWLLAADAEAEAQLWRELLAVDLVGTLSARGQPTDALLPLVLSDPWAAEIDHGKGMWLRVLDPAAALAGRALDADGEVHLEVHDEQGLASGRWRLVGQGGTASVTPSRVAPDVSLPVTTLGAVLLGGHRLVPLARAGQASEHRPGAVATLDRMLAWPRAPWCPLSLE